MKEGTLFMILLVCDTKDNRIDSLKKNLRREGVPCLSVRTDDVSSYGNAAAVFAFVPSENYLNTLSLRCKRIPVLAVNKSGSRIYNKDVLFYEESCGSYEDFIINFIKDNYGTEPGRYLTYDVTVDGRDVLCGLNSFRLTPAEYRIISLLAFSRGKWIDEKTIAAVCFDDSSKSCRVSVHICNINNKAKLYTGHTLVKTKRGKGYMLED